MTFPSKTVANNFLQWDFEDGSASLTPMKLQKLVYIAHGWFLAVHGKPLISEEFEAWPYGPVEGNLYHTFKQHRNEPITHYAKTWVGDKEIGYIVDSEEFTSIFDVVVKKYGPLSALELSALTHMAGTPWSITRNKGKTSIPNELIRNHFIDLVSND